MIDQNIHGRPIERGEVLFIGDHVIERRFHVVWASEEFSGHAGDSPIITTYTREFFSRDLAIAFLSFVLTQRDYSTAETNVVETMRELSNVNSYRKPEIPITIISFVVEKIPKTSSSMIGWGG